MALLKDGALAADPWTHVADDAPLPADGPVIVSVKRWEAERESLSARNAPLGLRLGSATPASAVAGDLDRFALVALEFPKFRDGRGFTTARDLRERFGFTGEIRAVGNVLPDQYLFLTRCGVSTVEVPDGTDPAPWARALTEFTTAYQPAATAEEPLAFLRRRITG